MAFDIRFWGHVSTTANSTYYANSASGVGTISGPPTLYSYSSSTDTTTQMSADNYFLGVINELKEGDLIYCVGTDGNVNLTVTFVNYSFENASVEVSPSNLLNGVTNLTGGTINHIPMFTVAGGQVIGDSGLAVNQVPILETHIERAFLRGELLTLTNVIELTNIGVLQFVNGVGTIFVDSLTGMQFIDNDFGPSSQVCTLITGDLPGSSTTPSALLELQSATGCLLLTRQTTTEIGDLTSPQDGMLNYDKTLQRFKMRQAGAWELIGIGGPGDGTVTSISAGTGISATPNPITTTGTIAIADTAVTPGSYTYASFDVNQQGQLTLAASGATPVTAVTGQTGQIVSSGGTTPNISLATTGVTAASYTYLSATIDAYGRIATASNGVAPVTSVTGTAGRISSTGGTTPQLDLIASGVVAATYTNATVTFDTYGRATSASSGTIPNLTAKYILQEADGALPNAQSLGDAAFFPSSGIVWNDVTGSTGVLRLAVAGVDYATEAAVVAAQSTATSAALAAVNAQTTANTAVAAATAAQSSANTATTTANSALALGTALALEKYIVQTASIFIPNAQSLGTLTTGLLKNTVISTTGTLSVASPGVDYYAPGYPTFIKDTNGGLNNFFIGTSAGSAITSGTNNTGVGINALAAVTSGNHTTALGYAAGSLRVSYIDCLFLGDDTDTLSSGLTNAIAIGKGARVGTSNSMVLGKGCFVGIGKESPTTALHLGTDNGTSPAIYITDGGSATPAAGDGALTVDAGRGFFSSGTYTSGYLPTYFQTGGAATAGSVALNGQTGVTVNTTSVVSGSIIFVSRNTDTGTPANISTMAGLAVGDIVNNTSFKIYSATALETNTVNWWIVRQ